MEAFHFYVKEPDSDYFHSKSDHNRKNLGCDGEPVSYRQVARILEHLCRNLKHSHPQLKAPSPWMVRCLAYNACAAIEDKTYELDNKETDFNWQALITDVLRAIHRHTDVGLEDKCEYTQLDGCSPLFPNADQFDEWDAYRTSQALLHQLEKELN